MMRVNKILIDMPPHHAPNLSVVKPYKSDWKVGTDDKKVIKFLEK